MQSLILISYIFIYLFALVIYLIRFDEKKHMMQRKKKIATKNAIQAIYKCFPNIYHGKF